jgi:hypothetical protein
LDAAWQLQRHDKGKKDGKEPEVFRKINPKLIK